MNKEISKFTKVKKNGGQAMLISVLFFVFISVAIILGLISPTLNSYKNARISMNGKHSLLLAETGTEDFLYRMQNGLAVTSSCATTGEYCIRIDLGDNFVETQVDRVIVGTERMAVATGNVSSAQRKSKIILNGGVVDNLTFEQGGGSVSLGGVTILDTSNIQGDVYSNGNVVGNGIADYGIYGRAYSAGPTGLIENVRVIEAHSNTVKDSFVTRDAYYQSIINTTVTGNSYPGFTNPASVTFPIDDTIIDGFKADALLGGEIGTYPCTYEVPAGNFGPAKVNCDLVFNAGTYNLQGAVWATGNITLNPGALVKTFNIGSNINVIVIADDPTDRITSSKIFINTAEEFNWSNNTPFFISKNNSSSLGGAEKAITITANNVTLNEKAYYFAPDGLISFENGVFADQALVAAHKLVVQGGSQAGLGNADIPVTPVFYSTNLGNWGFIYWREIP